MRSDYESRSASLRDDECIESTYRGEPGERPVAGRVYVLVGSWLGKLSLETVSAGLPARVAGGGGRQILWLE